MDEQDFVNFLRGNFEFTRGTGIGDDASVVPFGDGFQLITKDILVEGVHFSLDYFSLEELALKSLAVNVSDIAAMGGDPQYFYVGIGFPPYLDEADLRQFYKGLAAGCEKWGIELAGGDYSTAPRLFISITLVGFASKPVFRSGARPGDLIGITGSTGESALGLELLKRGIRDPYFQRRHIVVEPELAKGKLLAQEASSMIDVSDGIAIDLKRLLTASNVGGEIYVEYLPIDSRMREAASAHELDPVELALTGGEDYVLLFTVPVDREKTLRQSFGRLELNYHIIGKATSAAGTLTVFCEGAPLKLNRSGYDHFPQGG